MRYFRCKCGDREAISSMGVFPCEGCPKCGTTLAEGPDLHATPAPHEWYEEPVETDDGTKPLTRCRFCHRTRSEIEAEGGAS